MNTAQLNYILVRALERTNTHFLGVFPSDRVPISSHYYPCCFVANTDPEGKPGAHWLAFYYDYPNVVDFFDSYGMHPSLYSFDVPNILSFNPIQFQSYSSNVCGQYCIYFLSKRSVSKSLSEIVNRLGKCGSCTDNCVAEFTTRLIDSDYTKIPSLCTNQSCISRRK